MQQWNEDFITAFETKFIIKFKSRAFLQHLYAVLVGVISVINSVSLSMGTANLLIVVCLCIPFCGGQTCDKSIKMPKAMDIETFNTKVANTGEEWVALFLYVCPYNEFLASSRQWRMLLNASEGELHRIISYKMHLTAPCAVIDKNFVQVGSETAIFRLRDADNAPGILREDRYIDTGNLDDYYIQVTCRDRPVITDETKKTYECSNYVIIVMIRKVPPSQFPWTQALDDMKKFAPIEDKEIFFYYLGDVCPVQ